MALTPTTLNELADHLASIGPTLSLHTADPGATGANESSAARQPAGWAAAVNGDITASDVAFTGGAASGPCTHVGVWDADGTTFRGGYALAGDQAFNAAGEYTVTSLTINGSAS